jgi:flagellar motor switch protein FliN/FliY
MTFSASPLVPGQENADGSGPWRQAAELVRAAVEEALAQIPSVTPLTQGDPLTQDDGSALPSSAAAAITGYLGGSVEGKVLLVVSQDLVEALSATPFGALEPAQALKPALETIGDRLGGRLDGTPTGIAVEGCLDVLAGGTQVLVPLLAEGTVVSLVGVSLTTLPATGGGAAAGGAPGNWSIDMLRDVEMEVTCELGRTRMTVRQLLALAPGDVVELDRLAGAPADLLVNGTLLARGEVVVVDESFGLRITEIVTGNET